MNEGRIFLGGLPTDGDIKAIRRAFPDADLHDGQVIPYEQIEGIIQCDRKSFRFQTVTARWRKLVENETGSVVIGTSRGIGFKVLPAPEKVQLSFDYLRSAARRARRGYVVTTRVEVAQLSEEDRGRLMHAQRATASILAADLIKYRGDDLPSLL